MGYFDRLKKSQQDFLKKIGIYRDEDMPPEFFDTIKSLRQNLTEEEIYCVSDYYKSYCYNGNLDMTKLIGTDHDKYIGKSWIEAFCTLSRGEEIADLYLKNPDYYKNDDSKQIDMGVIEKDGYYYISSKNGGGNNRLITLKLLSIMQNKNGSSTVAPLVRFRKVPSLDTCKNIFFCEFPNGDFTVSGYEIKKTNFNSPEEYYDIIDGPVFTDNVIYTNVYGHEILETVLKDKNRNGSVKK